MISEQEAKEAAARLKNGGGDAFACWEDYQESSQKDEDVEVAANWICQELARRESERVERAKPIDAEWCVANGAVNVDGCNMFRWMLKVVRVDWDEHNGTTIDGTDFNWVFLPSIKTRGQLLDLLAALRGTERPA